MPDRYVTRAEIAARLNLTERRISMLVRDHEFPRRVEGRAVTFPSDRCFEWYLQFKQEEALARAADRTPVGPLALGEAELRKAVADADIAELRVAKLRGEVVPIESFRKELRAGYGRARARWVSVPGEYGNRFLHLTETAASVALLREMVNQVLAELQVIGAPEDEDEDDLEDEKVVA